MNFVNLVDAGDPVEIARRYNEQGADELTFLDITATSDGRDLILPIIEQVASQVFIPLTVGGGVRQVSDIQRLLNAGADKISINSAAVANPELVRAAADYHGSQCIVVAIDARRAKTEDGGERWEVFTHGGRKATGLDAIEWARRMAAYGAGEILLTSMDQDGTKSGFDLALTRAVSDAVPVPVIASGGVGVAAASGRGRHGRAAPTPCWPPASSTTASTPSRNASASWPAWALKYGWGETHPRSAARFPSGGGRRRDRQSLIRGVPGWGTSPCLGRGE